jgi:hypothetical protein
LNEKRFGISRIEQILSPIWIERKVRRPNYQKSGKNQRRQGLELAKMVPSLVQFLGNSPRRYRILRGDERKENLRSEQQVSCSDYEEREEEPKKTRIGISRSEQILSLFPRERKAHASIGVEIQEGRIGIGRDLVVPSNSGLSNLKHRQRTSRPKYDKLIERRQKENWN